MYSQLDLEVIFESTKKIERTYNFINSSREELHFEKRPSKINSKKNFHLKLHDLIDSMEFKCVNS
jgi:hypothetical protein